MLKFFNTEFYKLLNLFEIKSGTS